MSHGSNPSTAEIALLGALEEHAPGDLRGALNAGASPTLPINGQTPVETLIQGYLRSSRFGACLQILLDAGATVEDPLLEAILFDREETLREIVRDAAQLRRQLRVPCAFTSCDGVTALHLCAEFNSIRCARALLEAGADVNARAALDVEGFGGQTPVFHAVNSIFNYCRPTLELLVEAGARLDIRLQGLRWGPGADWETLVLDVTPMAYAQCGLYAQFHRDEAEIYRNISLLFQRQYDRDLRLVNVPNRYLMPKR